MQAVYMRELKKGSSCCLPTPKLALVASASAVRPVFARAH